MPGWTISPATSPTRPGSLFDALQVPDLLGSIPELSDPTPPLKNVLDGVTSALAPVSDVGSALTDLFGA